MHAAGNYSRLTSGRPKGNVYSERDSRSVPTVLGTYPDFLLKGFKKNTEILFVIKGKIYTDSIEMWWLEALKHRHNSHT